MTWWRRPGFQAGRLVHDNALNAGHQVKGLWFSRRSGDGDAPVTLATFVRVTDLVRAG
jgi:hypothetical protein